MCKKSMISVGKIAALGLIVAVLPGCGRGGQGLDSTKDLHYLPSNCGVIGSARVDEVVKSQAYKDMMAKITEMSKGESSQKEMEQTFGLSELDVARVTFGVAENGKEFAMVFATHKPVTASELIAKMKKTTHKFAGGKIEKQVEPRKFKEVKVGSFTMHEEEGEPGSPAALCVADKNTVVIGEAAPLKAILERNKPTELSAGMKAALDLANQSQPLYVAINVKGMMAGEAKKALRDLPPEAGVHSDKVDAVAIEAAIAADAQVKVVALCKDAAAAEAMQKDADKGLKEAKDAMAKMPKEPAEVAKLFGELNQVLNSVKVTASGNKVTGAVAIKPVVLLTAIESLGHQATTTFEKVGREIGNPNDPPVTTPPSKPKE